MADRITMQLVRAGQGEHVLVEAGGDDADAAAAAFDAAVAANSQPVEGPVFVRVQLDLADGTATIEGDPAADYDAAKASFDSAKAEYFAGPRWGGSG